MYQCIPVLELELSRLDAVPSSLGDDRVLFL